MADEPGTPPHAGTPDTADIDHSWDGEPAEPPRRGPREAMPTLHDPDPLRHDPGYRRDHDATRESFPTLTDIDPLRHDIDEPSSS